MTSTDNEKFRLVQVALWSSVNKPLTYAVSPIHGSSGLIGRRVIVPLGRRKQLGMIVETGVKFDGPIKRVDTFLDSEPLLTPVQIRLCRLISEYYFAPLGDCIKASLPQPLTARLNQRVMIVSRPSLQLSAEKGNKIAAAILKSAGSRKSLPYSSVAALPRKELKSLEEQGAIQFDWQARRRKLRRSDYQAQLVGGLTPGERLGAKGEIVINFLRRQGNTDLDHLQAELNVSSDTVNRLVKRGAVRLIEKPPFELVDRPDEPAAIRLSNHQIKAAHALRSGVTSEKFSPFLLFGVTASGKTEVYIEAIKESLRLGKNAIVIVPEIGLSYALFLRLQKVFGSDIALLHSQLSARARLDIWRASRDGKLRIVMGPRSAVFAPLANLGVIVVDEEHDYSLKQTSPSPRYHARDVAMFRGRLEQCTVVLGSATPAVESYRNALAGKYTLLTLPERVGEQELPEVSVIDLQKSFREKGYGYLTEPLLEAIKAALAKGGQVMMLLNRRGFAPSVHCYDCGQRFFCPDCAVSLVYHKTDNKMVCHLCGHTEPYPSSCPACTSNLFLYRGIGTQKLAEELAGYFPEIEIARMDFDTTRSRDSFRGIYEHFHCGKARILIGTQMIAKGFDFPEVALMVIVSTDTSLEFPDFRARERTFQLLAQASGRPGRKKFSGTVLFQTLHPDEPTINLAAKHDYRSFYEQEIADRQELDFPPFTHLILIEVESSDHTLAGEKAELIGQNLATVRKAPYEILGPTAAPVYKRQKRYRFHLLLKTRRVKTTLSYLRTILDSKPLQRSSKLSIIVDVDPVDML